MARPLWLLLSSGVITVVVFLAIIALAISLPATHAARVVGLRVRALDTQAISGQIKAQPRPIPNTGGVGIFAGLALPLVLGLLAVRFAPGAVAQFVPGVAPHLPGIAEQTPLAALFVGCVAMLHILGLIDDRKPLGPGLKLVVMIVPAVLIATMGQTRLLTLLDAHAGGPWLSILLTVLWFLVVTNALNFMDNMDGLCGGVAAIASALFLVAALLNGQWFVAACLALLTGALAGFLVLNFPPARIFMGDGGSLVVGFTLAFLTARTTYISPDAAASGGWYATLMPLVVLAIPLYDFTAVVLIRLRHGRSPMVGDLNHLSHRLVRRGLSRRGTVVVIYAFTAVTGLSGLLLAQASPTQAALIGVQVLCMLGAVAIFEFAASSNLPAISFDPKAGLAPRLKGQNEQVRIEPGEKQVPSP